jgi:hypothetical protein
MKMIVRVSPSKQRAWRMLEHIYSQGDYKAERDISNRVGEVRYQLASGVPTLDPKFDANLLLSRHHGKGKEARHLIFSGEELPNATPEQYQHALNGIVAAALDFAAARAPGHDFILVPHSDRHHPHIHLILAASNSERCIDWGPNDLKKVQGLDFVSPAVQALYQLEPGRGKGKRPPGVGRVAYDHAVAHDFHETHEQKIAVKLDYERILQAITDGDITVSRKTKNGKPLSVVLDGRVIRLSTLRKANAPAGSTGPAQPTAPSVAAPGQSRRRARARSQQRANGRVLGR